MSGDVTHRCEICGKSSDVVGALIGGEKMLCDECIVKACDLYAGAHAVPPAVVLDVMRYRQALRRIAQKQKEARAEMDKAAREHPDIATPNAKLDGDPS